jgi:hypothetical protein
MSQGVYSLVVVAGVHEFIGFSGIVWSLDWAGSVHPTAYQGFRPFARIDFKLFQ